METPNGVEKRQHERVRPQVRIEIQHEKGLQDFVNSMVHDISLGGIFVKTRHPRLVGTKIQFRLPYNQDQNVCELEGKVVRTFEPDSLTSGHPVAGMAVEFAWMGDSARALLKEIIAEYKAHKAEK